MASHATMSNAAHVRQARQKRLPPAGIGSRSMPRAHPSLGARLALRAIRLYQRHLSPIKGFSCPLRLATGGASCSGYGYRMIARHGLRLGLALLDRRLALCGDANRAPQSARNPLLHGQRGECAPDCDCDLPSGRGCIPAFGDVCDVLSCCDCGGGGGGNNRWREWRERRWLKRAARKQQKHAEREQQLRREREARERR